MLKFLNTAREVRLAPRAILDLDISEPDLVAVILQQDLPGEARSESFDRFEFALNQRCFEFWVLQFVLENLPAIEPNLLQQNRKLFLHGP